MRAGLGLGVVGVLCLAPLSASATDYYVAEGGVDGGSGTQDEPWATLQYAAEQVAPGDTVNVAEGSYAGFQLETPGTPDERIAFIASGAVTIDTDGPTGDGVRLQNVGNVTIEGFTIEGVSGRGIAHRGATPELPSNNIEIRGNTIAGTGQEGMYLSQVAMSLVEGNQILGTGEGGQALQGHCIYLANAGSDGTTLRGNHLSGCLIAGIHFNGDASIGGDGIISDITVEGNLIENCGQNGLNMDGVQDSRVVNNIIRGNASNGLRAYAIDASEGPRGLVIVNNTIHVPADGGWCVRITEESGAGGSVLFNNILLHDAAGGGGSIALDGTPGFSSDSNVVTGRMTPDRGDTILDLSAWQGLGYDAESATADPAETFVDAGAGEYDLRADSVAVDLGQDAFDGEAAPAADYRGAARPQGDGIDAGALERCLDPDDCEEGGSTGGETGGDDASADTGGTGGGDTGDVTGGGADDATGAGPTSGGGASGGGSGGATGDASGGAAGASEGDDAGCGCRASRHHGRAPWMFAFLALATRWFRVRRRAV